MRINIECGTWRELAEVEAAIAHPLRHEMAEAGACYGEVLYFGINAGVFNFRNACHVAADASLKAIGTGRYQHIADGKVVYGTAELS